MNVGMLLLDHPLLSVLIKLFSSTFSGTYEAGEISSSIVRTGFLVDISVCI